MISAAEVETCDKTETVQKIEIVHPILKKFGFTLGNKEGPSPLDVLNHLLHSNVVKEKDIETAHTTLKMRQSKVQERSALTQTKKSAKEAVIDDKSYRTRHVALRFYYDGADYSGLAENVGYDGDQSVEKSLFAALKKTNLAHGRLTSRYSRCGRTDKGVSSAGQVVGIYLKSNIPLNATWDEEGKLPISSEELPKNAIDKIKVWVLPKKGVGLRTLKEMAELPYSKILNNVLPENIRILGWCPVSSEFNARFSCNTRTYRYFFQPRQLNIVKMTEGLEMMIGSHDFRNFCKMDVEKVYNFERKIHEAHITNTSNHMCYFEIIGQAFLWHQIRCIVAVLLMIGRGEEEPSIVMELLNTVKHPGKPSYKLAPERPLVLHNCGYPNLSVGYDASNMWALCCHMEQQWEEFSLSAARIRNCIESLLDVPVLKSDVLDFIKAKTQERFNKQGQKPTHQLLQHFEETFEKGLSTESMLTWKQALDWMATVHMFPSPENLRFTLHVPLLQRSRGTTYEEKVESLQQSSKRKHKYEENIIKKRKSQEEDHAFYVHMSKQGGSAI